jgi:signal transduction histidine kinase
VDSFIIASNREGKSTTVYFAAKPAMMRCMGKVSFVAALDTEHDLIGTIEL